MTQKLLAASHKRASLGLLSLSLQVLAHAAAFKRAAEYQGANSGAGACSVNCAAPVQVRKPDKNLPSTYHSGSARPYHSGAEQAFFKSFGLCMQQVRRAQPPAGPSARRRRRDQGGRPRRAAGALRAADFVLVPQGAA